MASAPAVPQSETDRWPRRLAYITSGAANMFCGSCLHDNTLVRAMRAQAVDATLVPTYTPIRTDEQDVSVDQVFFGGASVFLEQKFPPFRLLPRWATRWLDRPNVLRIVSRWGGYTTSASLGALTVSMLRGKHGHQHREAAQLVRWMAEELRPDVICLSNVLIAGCAPELQAACRCPVLVTLQGDDIFLDELPAPYYQQAEQEIRRLTKSIDGFLFHSRFYADRLSKRFGIPAEKQRLVPLGIDTTDFESMNFPLVEPPDAVAPPTGSARASRNIGYLARLAPEKGLHVLVDAFIALRRRPGHEHVQLKIAGWLGDHRRKYVEQQFQRMRDAGLDGQFEYVGEVDRAGKVRFLQSLDVLSVPTVYEDPKGLFVLESLAAGVPVVQPAHGAFPELLGDTGGGLLVRPNDATQLADALGRLLGDDELRHRLAAEGRQRVLAEFNARRMAERTLATIRQFER